ncbi:hypothetical protein AR687_08215 [Flavobacteriaceae bacterium CRH]|nr:hypothetical protein AR687_08215 [Flavobacteriaceae bacterium CRH]
MIKKTLFLLITTLILASCKHQNDENKSINAKSNNSAKKIEKPKKLLFKCKENDNGISRYDDPLNRTCVCNETTFNPAYEIFYNESPDYIQKDLLKKLPQKDFVWKSPDAEVTYSWIMQDTLKINMFYQGGENNYVFYKNNNNKIEFKEYLSLP